VGFLDSELENVGDDSVSGVLQNFGNKLQHALRESLRNKVHGITPKNLEQSIVFDVDFQNNVYTFELLMEDYGTFLDEGVQGVGGVHKTDTEYSKKGSLFVNKGQGSRFKYSTKKPPLNQSAINGSSLRQYSAANGLNMYALRESIFRQGIKPTHFYSDVVNQSLLDELTTKLEKAGAKGIELELVQVLAQT